MASRKNCPNKTTKAARDIINKVLPPEERYGLLAELARGVRVKKTKEIIYEEKPDSFALKFLCEMADGKPAQSVDLTNNGYAFQSGVLIINGKTITQT